MERQKFDFEVGSQVIHWVYGPGEVIELDEKVLDGHTDQYYVVQVRDLTMWVPVHESSSGCLRLPTPAEEFETIFELLANPGEPLSADRLERKNLLTERLKAGSLESVCLVVRDLSRLKQEKRMNDNDNLLLDRARCFLIEEWSMAFSIPVEEAERQLNHLLNTAAATLEAG